MNTVEVFSLDDIASAIVGIYEKKPGWLWFRGHRDVSWNLHPSVWRDHTEQVERYMSNRFYARARTRHPHSPGNEDWAGWISLMQHYGLPTRLLDWTMSALVAAFFATHKYRYAENVKTTACIWVIDAIGLNISQGFEPVAPPLNYWMAERLVRPAFKGKDREDDRPLAKVIAAMAVESDPRMQVQQGAFTVHTTAELLTNLPGTEKWLHQLVIPTDAAKHIAWQLAALGVRESELFPDLDHLASDLRNEFAAHNKKT
jgi:hypothetical protein